ncbi:hypothetical protein D3C87_2201110 [compost metagenome]
MPLSTAMPNRAMKPMAAETLRCKLRSHRAVIPPTVASGRIIRTVKACLTELNVV